MTLGNMCELEHASTSLGSPITQRLANQQRGNPMSENPMTEFTDDQLSFEVRAALGAGGGAAMEAIQRLRDRLDIVTQSNHRYEPPQCHFDDFEYNPLCFDCRTNGGSVANH
jgi:hypothetical protein